MIEAVLIGAFILGGLAVILPRLAGAAYKRRAYKRLDDPNPSARDLREVIGGLSRVSDAEAKRLGDDLHAKLKQTHLP